MSYAARPWHLPSCVAVVWGVSAFETRHRADLLSLGAMHVVKTLETIISFYEEILFPTADYTNNFRKFSTRLT